MAGCLAFCVTETAETTKIMKVKRTVWHNSTFNRTYRGQLTPSNRHYMLEDVSYPPSVKTANTFFVQTPILDTQKTQEDIQ